MTCEHLLIHQEQVFADGSSSTGRFVCQLCNDVFFCIASSLPSHLQREAQENVMFDAMMEGRG